MPQGSELSQTVSDSAVSSLTSSSQAVSSVSDSARAGSANAGGAGAAGSGTTAGITKQRNREAAKDYRRRKKEYMRQLQADVERLQQEKADLASQCTTLQTENTMLRGLVRAPRVGEVAVPVVDHGYAQHHRQQQLYRQQLQAQAQYLLFSQIFAGPLIRLAVGSCLSACLPACTACLPACLPALYSTVML